MESLLNTLIAVELILYAGGGLDTLGKGLATLEFNKLENETFIFFDLSAPNYRTINDGFNLEGICHNEKCRANGKKVWVPKKYGSFNMNKIARIGARCPVPACGQLVDKVTNCGFYKCVFSFLGAYKDKEGKIKEIEIFPRDAPDDKLLTYSEEESIVEWCFLTITVKEKMKPLV